MRMKLNRKGYMLVEIILASVLAMSIFYYLLNLTYKFKDKDEAIYHSITYMNHKNMITKNIMDDLMRGSVSNYEIILQDSSTYSFKFQLKMKVMSDANSLIEVVENRMLEVKRVDSSDSLILTYGKYDDTFVTTDVSYYQIKVTNSMLKDLTKIVTENNDESISIRIPISYLYDEGDYDIKIFMNKLNPR